MMIAAYLLNSSLIWALSLLLYLLFFRNKAFFRTNRTFLIGSLLAGLLIPIIQQMEWLTISATSPIRQAIIAQENLIELPRLAASVVQEPTIDCSAVISFPSILLILYMIGILITSAKFLNGLWDIRKIHLSGKAQSKSGLQLIVHNHEKLPFSFFNSVYLNQRLLKHSSLSAILKHEKAHITGRHSVDILILEILKIIFWFHPLVYIYKNLIKEVQEFIADAEACLSVDRKKYCMQLLQANPSFNKISLGNNFFTNNLKNRISMVNQKNKNQYLRYILILPLFITILLLWSCQTNEDTNHENKYEVGAAVENILEENYFDSKKITEQYDILSEKYPEHLPYIKERLKKHFSSLGGTIIFDEEEIDKQLCGIKAAIKANNKLELTDDIELAIPQYYVEPFSSDISKLPTLQPIKISDLKKTIIPGPQYHPLKKVMKYHKGTDYVASMGSPVLAAGNGLVTDVQEYERGYGNCIRIDHDNGMETFYAHLSEVLVKRGDLVSKGKTIGKVGNSGSASSPHLHFELLRDGKEWDMEIISQVVE